MDLDQIMKLHILFGLRKEHYAEKYGPEILLAWDEFSHDENFEGWTKELTEKCAFYASEMQAMRVIVLDVSQKQIRELLVGTPVVKATIAKVPAIEVVEAPGDMCGNTKKLPDGSRCPGCRACC